MSANDSKDLGELQDRPCTAIRLCELAEGGGTLRAETGSPKFP